MHKPAVAVAVDMEVVAVEATWAASAEVAWVVSAEVTSPACTEITLAMEDVISFAAAFTATVLIARTTSRTAGHTAAPTERWANWEVANAQLSPSHDSRI